MARRIVYAKNTGYASDRETALWIDRWIEIDCKDKVLIDQWSGDVAIEPPSYLVGLPSRTFEGDRPTIMEYGRIEDSDDIAWLKQVAYRSAMEGTVPVQMPVPMVARIHHLKLRRDGYEGLEVEALTRGVAVLGETVVDGKSALKFTILNPCLTTSDFTSLINKIQTLAIELAEQQG